MKKVIYSPWLKALAVILFLASLTLGCLVGIQGVQYFEEENNYIYDFGSSLEDSWYFRYLLSLPESLVLGTLHELTYIDPYAGYSGPIDESTPTTVQSPNSTDLAEATELILLEQIEERLKHLPYLEYIEYYVNLNGTIFTNTELQNPDNLQDGIFKHYAIDTYGEETIHTSLNFYSGSATYDYDVAHIHFDPLIISTRIRPEYVAECAELWETQEAVIYNTGSKVLICILALLLPLVYLICVCGKDKEGNRIELWVDKVWAEFHLAAIGGFGFGCLFLCVVILQAAFDRQFPIDGAFLLSGIMIPIAGGLILCSLLALIRNLKAGLFAKRCLILFLPKKILSFLWFLCKQLRKGICHVRSTLATARRFPVVLFEILALFLYTVLTVGFVVIATEGAGGTLLLLFPLFGFGAYLLSSTGKDLHRIKEGAAEIRNGNLSHEIPTPSTHHLKPLAENINHIAKGLETSLTARLKAERMKTDLITNVSHDLKTPLTSIITYTELLSRVENLPEEAEDYIRIIGDKSQRLKSLTQDLFDISKVQSGNEEVRWEVLDAALLLQQSLAEERGDALIGNHPVCLKTEENLTFMGDGGKLSRVLGNLIQNASKYSMDGTRIFLSAFPEEDQVIIECKNTSAYPLDFSPEEILGRFVRGDSARSTEGNGLGLPIAKSYTELCGGTFQLTLDGDLFKVRLSFPKTK